MLFTFEKNVDLVVVAFITVYCNPIYRFRFSNIEISKTKKCTNCSYPEIACFVDFVFLLFNSKIFVLCCRNSISYFVFAIQYLCYYVAHQLPTKTINNVNCVPFYDQKIFCLITEAKSDTN